MLKAAIVSTVDFCIRFAYLTIVLALLIGGFAVYYSSDHFAINTDITKVFSKDIVWRQREVEFDRLFSNREREYILAVVDAPTLELASLARAELADKLAADKALFKSVNQLGGSPFFAQNGLLFLPTQELAGITKSLTRSAPLMRALVTDPSLRGVAGLVGFALAGVNSGQLTLDQAARAFNMAAPSPTVRRRSHGMSCSAARRRPPEICRNSSKQFRCSTSTPLSLVRRPPTRSGARSPVSTSRRATRRGYA
jgi:uncharacterized protein